MDSSGAAGFCILLLTGFMSWKGISNPAYLNRYAFHIDSILVHKDYKRLVTSGFIHAGWMHLFFNMITLYCFSDALESLLGLPTVLGLYLGSLIGGNLLALYIHRNHGDYSAVGASGAVSGLVFASIALFPGIELRLFLIPYAIPGWLFGLAYVAYSIYGIKSQRDNIGHEAHLGGGLVGMAMAIALHPHILQENYLPILVITLPAVAFLYIIISRPYTLMVDKPFGKRTDLLTVEDRYHTSKIERERELDRLLEKIHQKGISSLTKKEKETLDQFSEIQNTPNKK